jgi:hypothetical protein
VHKRILPIATAAFLFSLIIAGCTKLDTTDIGSDLLPAVDNVNTFDTILTINTSQGVFLDSTKVANTDDQVLGKISNDPLFGTTTAGIYAQFKPTFFPYYYGSAKDTIIGFDSVVLCLSYKGFWGDSITQPLKLEVRQVPLNAGGLWDSLYQSKPVTYVPGGVTGGVGPLLGSTVVDFNSIGNYIKYSNGKDSVKNQIRIKLSPSAYASALYTQDSVGNHTFRSDSIYKLFDNGLAITATSGNGLLYTNLTDSSSKLEIHFRRKNGGLPDTTFSAFQIYTAFGSSISPSATVDNIVRNRPAQVANPPAGELYLQATPGTYVNLDIPALSTLSNRIIHRAEIIVEQIPFSQPSDTYFSAPNFLYLDLQDTGATKWKPIYFDLNPAGGYDPDFKVNSYFPSAGIDFAYFGGFVRDKTDLFGTPIKFYNFNISRYVQQIVTKHTNNYRLRMYAPYDIVYPQYAADLIPFNNRLAKGRVKIGSGSNPNYKMRLRIVYSKL